MDMTNRPAIIQIISKLTPRVKFIIDLIMWSVAAPLALFARVDIESWHYLQPIIVYSLMALLIKAPLAYRAGLHRQRWRTISVHDLETLLKAVGTASGILFIIHLVSFPLVNIPRSVPLIEGVLAIMLLGGIRLSSRLFHERNSGRSFDAPRKRVLIVGAGDTGTMLVREMFRHPESGLDPVGFLDDDPHKHRDRFLGLPVLGTITDLPKVVHSTQITQILIAMPTAGGDVIRKVVSLSGGSHVPYRIIPAYHEILSGKVSISQIREVEVEDLLKRPPIELNTKDIAGYLTDRVVMVTGAGGSIGSEIVRQIARFNPKEIVLLDHHETGMYYLQRELEIAHPNLGHHLVIANIQHKEKLDWVFKQLAPQVVFHAAAHKHVPLMENNPDEAILNNIRGTEYLLEASINYGVERFVNISTDKAVKPTSIMGACKRVSEFLVRQAASSVPPGCVFVSVRFGNVLGSQGSVVPVFKEQIRRGGPVTITHPEMVRYFMTIPEAAQLVLQAAGLGHTGVVYVLEMGEPVKIVDLANDLIRLTGLTPGKDIEIIYTGIRPGEKLYEQLLTDQEVLEASKYEGILIARQTGIAQDSLNGSLAKLYAAAAAQDHAKIRKVLGELIPTYHSNGAKS